LGHGPAVRIGVQPLFKDNFIGFFAQGHRPTDDGGARQHHPHGGDLLAAYPAGQILVLHPFTGVQQQAGVAAIGGLRLGQDGGPGSIDVVEHEYSRCSRFCWGRH